MSQHLDEIIYAQKRREARGIASICSAHPWVLRTALQGDLPVLIESTCNQVNQFGGYSGMKPADFIRFVGQIAAHNKFPQELLLLGGDHLGPSPWQEEPAGSAMLKAAELVRLYVQAGYTKIHLDASMRLADDPPGALAPETSSHRTAELARVAEESHPHPAATLRYVIGTEVPPPGGVRQQAESLHITTVENARHTLELTHAAFVAAGLESAWERVIALVVQPGVEYGDDLVIDYKPAAAQGLAQFAEGLPFVYEAHSTDYQDRQALRLLVRDHFAILKVGPALTFAFREAVFALAMMENEMFPAARRSNLMDVLEQAMLRQPGHWQNYYHGDEAALRLSRKFSLSDRLRYYWGDPLVQTALDRLLHNLGEQKLPQALVSQYAPGQWERIRSGQIASTPETLILDKVNSVVDDYAFACGASGGR